MLSTEKELVTAGAQMAADDLSSGSGKFRHSYNFAAKWF